MKVFCRIQHDLGTAQEYLHIKNIGTSMHVKPLHFHVGGFHNTQYMRQLVNGNSEF